MKKTKFLFIVFMVVVLTGIFSVAMADQEKNKNKNQSPKVCIDKCGNGTCEEVVCMGTNCPCAETKASCPKDCKLENENRGEINSDQHRNIVSGFVQKLLNVADRQKGGIGEQVRVIAQEQDQNKEKIADQIDAVQKRNKIKTFLIGTDYKNIGALRSEMVQVRNRIDQLNKLVKQTTNEADKTELQAQITAIKTEQVSIETMLTTNESKFSLFGWVRKLFSKKSE